MPGKIPIPITYNPYKHHFVFLLNAIEKWQKMSWQDVESELLSVGSNLIDFYLGELSAGEVCKQTIDFFAKTGVTKRIDFLKWLEPPNWKKIVLSDDSEWLVKQGNDLERFIHIHPAKHSPHTIRVRALTLKTVLALEIKQIQLKTVTRQNLESVNHIRKEFLQLSPIKSLRKNDSGILRLWKLFQTAPANPEPATLQ